MFKNALGSLFIACILLLPVATYGNNNESLGYRYRVSFEINDHIGKATIHVYTNTWVYNPISSSGSDVWLANPHQDIAPSGDFSSVIVAGCTMLVGKGILVIERPGAIENEVRQHEKLTIMHSVSVYDFLEKAEIKFDRAECRQ